MKIFQDLFKKVSQAIVKSGSWDRVWLEGRERNFLEMMGGIEEPYRQHQTVFMCLDAIAVNLPQAYFSMYKGGVDGVEIKDLNNPLVKLFNAPNPLMCRYQLWEATALFLAYRGECFWLMQDEQGLPVESNQIPAMIWVIDPNLVKQNFIDGVLRGWKFGGKTYSLNSFLFFKKFNMFDTVRGFSPLEPIRKMTEIDFQAMMYNKAFFQNGAEPYGFLTTEQKLNDESIKRIRENFEGRHQGAQKAKRVAILEGGLQYTPGSENHKDMEFLEQRKYTREEIMGIWRTPKSLFSITDDINYATAIAQKRLFWENTLIPMLKYFEEVLNGHFFPRFAPTTIGQFDTADVPALKDNFTEKITAAKILFDMGFTGNEINKRLDLGFDDKTWRDIWWIPFSQVPAGETPTQVTDPNATPATDPNNAKYERLAELISKSQNRKTKWENFAHSIGHIENTFESKIKKYLFEVRVAILKEVAKNYEGWVKTKALNDLSQFDWMKYNDLLKKLTNPIYLSAVSQGVKNGVAALGSSIDFDIFNPLIISFVKEKEMKITRINDTTKKNVMDIVADGITNGSSVQDVQNKLKESFNFSASRAMTIARTEVVSAANGGELLSYIKLGVKKKEWLTARDELVRESHKELEGVSVNVNKKFPNGLNQPGDQNGEPEEVINCRCTMIPILE